MQRCIQIYIYVGQARWSLSEARVDMNAATLLQQTAPYSFLSGLCSLLLFCLFPHAYYQFPFISPFLPQILLLTPFANRYVSDFFLLFEKRTFAYRVKARGLITNRRRKVYHDNSIKKTIFNYFNYTFLLKKQFLQITFSKYY